MDGEERLNGINNWEEECVDSAECDLNDLEEKLAVEREQNSQRLWLSFQNAANSVAQLFKERGDLHGSSLWAPFQDTANLVTILYKDSLDVNKRNFDAGYQLGHKKRNREVIAWAKKKKRAIRRDELLSYLSGHSPPRYQRVDAMDDRANEDIGVQRTGTFSLANSLHNPFLSSGVSVPAMSFPGWNKPRRSSRSENFANESENRENFKETRKRSISNQDVVMDSAGHKKCRFL